MNPRNKDVQKFINLKTGAFYASCFFMAVIKKRFGTTELWVLCIEAVILGISSVESYVEGKAL